MIGVDLAALVLVLAWPAALSPSTSTTPSEDPPTTEVDPAEATSPPRLDVLTFGAGYHGSLTRLRHDAPGPDFDLARHGAEARVIFGATRTPWRRGRLHGFHMSWASGRVVLATTRVSSSATASPRRPEPRHGTNVGIMADARGYHGLMIGGLCGGALALGETGSVKALTRSTVPGNRLQIGLHGEGGLRCDGDRGALVLTYSIGGLVGVEQIQDLAVQQGSRAYSPRDGNGLLLYGAHGPSALFVRVSSRTRTILFAQWLRSIGRGRFGGERSQVYAQLALVVRANKELAVGFAPWYRLDVARYGEASGVLDPNERWSHSFGGALVVSLIDAPPQ